ncbi:MAG: hypothetical protein QXD53_06710 [Candidatus Bathyarchaeia archaeon]
MGTGISIQNYFSLEGSLCRKNFDRGSRHGGLFARLYSLAAAREVRQGWRDRGSHKETAKAAAKLKVRNADALVVRGHARRSYRLDEGVREEEGRHSLEALEPSLNKVSLPLITAF